MVDFPDADFPPPAVGDDPYPLLPAEPIANPGSDMLYNAATGFERAAADSDAERLIRIPAEIIITQWNPWQISAHNLPFLAWAMGVPLWPDWWTEDFKRAFTARQWQLKAWRGTEKGIEEYVAAMGGTLKKIIAPPQTPYATQALTAEERASYIARFAQLRLYPYVARALLPWCCFPSSFAVRRAYSWIHFHGQPEAGETLVLNGTIISFVAGAPGALEVQIGLELADTLDNLMALLTASADPEIAACEFILLDDTETIGIVHRTGGRAGSRYTLAGSAPVSFLRGLSTLLGGRDAVTTGEQKHAHNGSFLGPLWNLYPTSVGTGGRYTRTAKLWDRGVETNLTFRKVEMVDAGPMDVRYYDVIVLPPHVSTIYHIGDPRYWLRPARETKRGIFLGRFPGVPSREVKVPRDGSLELIRGQAKYATYWPNGELIDLYPEHKYIRHAGQGYVAYAFCRRRVPTCTATFLDGEVVGLNVTVAGVGYVPGETYAMTFSGGGTATNKVMPTAHAIANELGRIERADVFLDSGGSAMTQTPGVSVELPPATGTNSVFLYKKFLPPTISWQYIYEVWYLHDADRVPDYRKRQWFMGNCRFGIHKYTAEARIKCFGIRPRRVVSRYLWGFMRPKQTVTIDRMRAGVRAAMALRDQVLIDTKIMRTLEVRDVINADGTHYVDELIER